MNEDKAVYCAGCGKMLAPDEIVIQPGDNYFSGDIYCCEACLLESIFTEYGTVKELTNEESN